MRALLLWAGVVLSLACASAPKPRVLTDADAASHSPAVTQAKSRAPQAFARAEDLRRRAQLAHDDGRHADAEFLAEHALAAYQRAVIEGRLSAAEARAADADAKLAARQRDLGALDEQNRRELSEAENLELRLKVVREILPVPASAAATPERERARLDAARALALEARLLCSASRLLEPERASLKERFAKLDELDQRLHAGTLPAPIDDARGERSNCLRELTLTRRPVSQKAPAAGQADTLLSELSGTGLAPVRDDRGVVVTLRAVFASGNDLSGPAREQLTSLGRVAKSHPTFPVLVVAHSGKAGSIERDKLRAEAVAHLLTEQGAGRVEAYGAGSAEPVLDPTQPSSAARNERVEVVFVSPSAI
jgi:outer membrane protein OmpA-like peptidoglycan-associated protein